MGKYGDVAVLATTLMREGVCNSAPEAWRVAARELFPGRKPSQEKACPKNAYLGLCEEGLVVGVPAGRYAKGAENKAYALEAVRLLKEEPAVAAAGSGNLWNIVMDGREKVANSQMEVVLALWANGLIAKV